MHYIAYQKEIVNLEREQQGKEARVRGGKELFLLTPVNHFSTQQSVCNRAVVHPKNVHEHLSVRISMALSTAKQSTGVSIHSERRGKTALGQAFFLFFFCLETLSEGEVELSPGIIKLGGWWTSWEVCHHDLGRDTFCIFNKWLFCEPLELSPKVGLPSQKFLLQT